MFILDQLLDRIHHVAAFEITDDDILESKKCLLDFVGVSLAGSFDLHEKHHDYLFHREYLSGFCPVIGTTLSCDPYSSILLNALSAHEPELDDGHRFGMVHPGVPVISSLITDLACNNISVDSFLKAIVVGYDATIRLAYMVQPVHKKRGFHATSTCGTFGASIGLCYARRYDDNQIRCVASAALTSASGLLEMNDDGSQLKPYNCAQAAVNAFLAANVGECGYVPPFDALGGKRGFLISFNGSIECSKIDQALCIDDCIHSIYRKTYASCRHTHSAVEAALHIRSDPSFSPDGVQVIEIMIYDFGLYGHDHTSCSNISSAKMSTPYSVAVALVYGLYGIDAFTDDLLRDSRVIHMASLVSMRESSELSELVPAKRSAIVRVTMVDGRVFTERVDYPKGEPENPLCFAELQDKFFRLASYAGMSHDNAAVLVDSIMNIEEKKDIFLEMIQQH